MKKEIMIIKALDNFYQKLPELVGKAKALHKLSNSSLFEKESSSLLFNNKDEEFEFGLCEILKEIIDKTGTLERKELFNSVGINYAYSYGDDRECSCTKEYFLENNFEKVETVDMSIDVMRKFLNNPNCELFISEIGG